MFPIQPPIEPMLAKLADALPTGGGFLYEPKWDGFRAIVFRGYVRRATSRAAIFARSIGISQSSTTRCWRSCLPGSVVDGEIVIATPHGPRFRRAAASTASGGFTRRQAFEGDPRVVRRLRPAGRRTAATCATSCKPSEERCWRTRSPASTAPIHLTPMTRDPASHRSGSQQFEGAGLDGVDREARVRDLRTGQARDDQDQARANGGLRGGRVPVAQAGQESS